MEQFRSYADERLIAGCIHCGCATETRDHVPSRVLLDEPYPENLPVLPACAACNAALALDEEYFACLVECARTGSVDAVERRKIKRILEHTPGLAARISQARNTANPGGISFNVEAQRVKNVLVKLAKGHAAFEHSQTLYHPPDRVSFAPICTLEPDLLDHFETPLQSNIWPEVGSRAMQRLIVAPDRGIVASEWVVVQEGAYRYLAAAGGPVTVRIVIGEYLACEVVWEEPYP